VLRPARTVTSNGSRLGHGNDPQTDAGASANSSSTQQACHLQGTFEIGRLAIESKRPSFSVHPWGSKEPQRSGVPSEPTTSGYALFPVGSGHGITSRDRMDSRPVTPALPSSAARPRMAVTPRESPDTVRTETERSGSRLRRRSRDGRSRPYVDRKGLDHARVVTDERDRIESLARKF
jgi:hypothetical protein